MIKVEQIFSIHTLDNYVFYWLFFSFKALLIAGFCSHGWEDQLLQGVANVSAVVYGCVCCGVMWCGVVWCGVLGGEGVIIFDVVDGDRRWYFTTFTTFPQPTLQRVKHQARKEGCWVRLSVINYTNLYWSWDWAESHGGGWHAAPPVQ